MNPIFYIYELCYPEGQVFYVGKGTDDGRRLFKRANQHWRKNQFVKLAINKLRNNHVRPIIKIVFESPNENQTFAEEERLIKLYGRKFDGGILYNVSLGGKCNTWTGRHMPQEVKNKISQTNKGKKRSVEMKQRMSLSHLGKKLSPTHIQNQSRARTGIPCPEHVKLKISLAQKGKPRKKHSLETKERMAKSAVVGWTKRRLRDAQLCLSA